jgi:hypothetical protein
MSRTLVGCDLMPLGQGSQLQPGMIITLRRGLKKAGFRVQWIRQLGPNELQAQKQNNFWGVNLSDQLEAKKDMQAFLTLLSSPSKSVT